MGTVNQLDQVSRANPAAVEALYARYLADPSSVDETWAGFFAGFELGAAQRANGGHGAHGGNGAAILAKDAKDEIALSHAGAPAGVYSLVHAYRELGHYVGKLDPLRKSPPPPHPLLAEVESRFSDEDLDRVVEGAGGLRGLERASVREILARLQATYCGTIGVQYMEIPDKAQREWIQERIEPSLNKASLSRDDRHAIHKGLVLAEEFEQFLHHKYIGAKRFSIEGAESVIPLLETVIEEAADTGAEEVVMGMAHRGRLNVLAHTLRKPLEWIMAEFEGKYPEDMVGDGDVKYHMGFSHDHVTRHGQKIHLSLSPNPSHLEHVNPVIEGIVRAKQDRKQDGERRRVVPLLIHGDAAFTGQGIVAETLALSELAAYETGGTIHVIIDNRVGFTASPKAYRFTPYASDLARLIHAPVFHVNGDDPEAAVQAARLAVAYRQQFHMDVIIDVICYRRHGHNETDEPRFTQPQMYRDIDAHPTTRKLYEERLLADGHLSAEEAKRVAEETKASLEAAREAAKSGKPKQKIHTLGGLWQGLTRAEGDRSAETRVPRETLERIARGVMEMPAGFVPHPKIRQLYEQRLKAITEPGGKLDWGTAEMLAHGSLVLEGTRVRVAGQDAGRGTFSHRHAVLHDTSPEATTSRTHTPLDHLDPRQARFSAIDTMLSEEAVFGFELGYSWADPWTLVCWEAQFGDFANVAQAMIDVFLVAAETKWQRMSGMVLLLPHGYEGQGPEHSSARLERFLQLCGNDNLQVVNLTTPAQFFHALRRQMKRSFRKPLVVMSPKSLLRLPAAASTVDDLVSGSLELVKGDVGAGIDPAKVTRVVLTSGRLYYTLAKARDDRKIQHLPIVRLEQYYPFPRAELLAEIAKYPGATEVIWAQEEPWNMGAWHFVDARLRPALPEGRKLIYAGRDESATTATGSSKKHAAEEEKLLRDALGA